MSKFLVRKAAVLGAGVMGAQIAAHLANAGVQPVLFELAAEGRDKNANVRKALDGLPTGRTLLTVKTDVALPFEIESLVQGEPDREKLAALYERFGFRGMREALLKGDGGEDASPSPRPSPKGEGNRLSLLPWEKGRG